ncbi:D-3-phosphoglycerate dehydrogenase [Mannheimia haemolytica]
MLNQINQIFVESNVNIAAQYLQTDAAIGYVVIDVESDNVDEALQRLKAIEGTIRARVLY